MNLRSLLLFLSLAGSAACLVIFIFSPEKTFIQLLPVLFFGGIVTVSVFFISPASHTDHLKEVADSIPSMIWRVNSKAEAIYVNETWMEFTGLSFEESLDFKWIQALHPEDRQEQAEIFQTAFAQRIPFDTKFRLRRKNGEFRYVFSRGKVLYNPEFDGYIGCLTDITEQELDQQAAQQLIRQKDEFLSIASHELKTPVTSIKASLQILKRGGKQSSDITDKFLNKALNQIDRLSKLIEDLLDNSRINAGKMEINPCIFTLHEAVAECLDSLKNLHPEHQFSFISNINYLLKTDRFRLEQVISNFLSNAVKYSPSGSEIIVSLTEERTGHVRCSVSDQGIGIPSEKLPLIFERFYQVRPNSPNFQGLGLGLYIASEIIKKLGGQIGASSEEGKGSKFWFELPIYSEQPETSDAEPIVAN